MPLSPDSVFCFHAHNLVALSLSHIVLLQRNAPMQVSFHARGCNRHTIPKSGGLSGERIKYRAKKALKQSTGQSSSVYTLAICTWTYVIGTCWARCACRRLAATPGGPPCAPPRRAAPQGMRMLCAAAFLCTAALWLGQILQALQAEQPGSSRSDPLGSAAAVLQHQLLGAVLQQAQ